MMIGKGMLDELNTKATQLAEKRAGLPIPATACTRWDLKLASGRLAAPIERHAQPQAAAASVELPHPTADQSPRSHSESLRR